MVGMTRHWSALAVAVLLGACFACAEPQPRQPPPIVIPPEYQKEVHDLQQIIEHYHASVPPELSPHHAATHLRLGVIYYTIGQFDEAVYHLNQSTTMDPSVAAPHLYLGRVFEKQGHDREALEELKTAVKMNPDLTDARDELARLSEKMNAGPAGRTDGQQPPVSVKSR